MDRYKPRRCNWGKTISSLGNAGCLSNAQDESSLAIQAAGQSSLIELDQPNCQDGEVLIKLSFVAFCGSDLSTYQGRNPMVTYPRIPGHEIAGRVEAVGKGVHGFTPNDLVTVIPYTACGKCPSCKRGRSNACRDNKTLGVQREGAMTEYISVPADKVLKVDGLELQELALIEPLTVGFHSVERAQVTQVDTVLIFGCGMIGLGAIAAAAHRGAKVVAVDVTQDKLKLAQTLGAKHAINSSDQDLALEVKSITKGDLADVVIEAVGHPATYRSAVEMAAFAGRVSCIGYAKEDVAITTKLIVQKELDIRGSRNATRQDFETVIQYLKSSTFPIENTVTSTFTLEEAPEQLEQWSKAPGAVTKLMVKF